MLPMKPRIPALVALALAFVTQAWSQTDTAPAPAAPPAPTVNLEANDTARFLAGLPPSSGSQLAELAKDAAWQEHAKFFDTAWAALEKNQLAKIRAWDAAYIAAAATGNAPVFYMFSGPDFLYVNAFYPNASTYVLCGIEPIGLLPDVNKIRPGTLRPELQNIQTSLNSVLNFSFFITKDMKVDLQNHELGGTLPLIYIFLARSNKTINEVSYVGIDATGQVQPIATANMKNDTLEEVGAGHSGLINGVKITFSQPNAAEPQTLYYFRTDISDDGIKKTGGFLKFCESLAPGNSFVKSASYLMHESYFSTIRSFLLKSSLTLVQDDSGIPVSNFTTDKWQMRYFGSYPGPIDIFKKYLQPDLLVDYKEGHPIPLDFGIGYRHYASQSTLILAVHKLASDSGPAPTPVEGKAVPKVSSSIPTAIPAPAATPDAPLISPLLPATPAEKPAP